MAVSEVKLPVSEVKPPPKSRSGQKCPLEVQKVVARTVFQGDHDGRGLVSQNPGVCLFKPIKEGTCPALEVTDIEKAVRWSNFQI
jgi:hypothetical protein